MDAAAYTQTIPATHSYVDLSAAIADVLVPGFFDPVAGGMAWGDAVWIAVSDGGGWYRIVGTAPVTLA